MAVFIYQPDALELMAKLEGQEWLDKQRRETTSPYAFPLWLEAWNIKASMGPECAEERLADFVADRFPNAIEAVIYGKGGYHRYVVRSTGEVMFSAMHAVAERRPLAQELGFTLC